MARSQFRSTSDDAPSPDRRDYAGLDLAAPGSQGPDQCGDAGLASVPVIVIGSGKGGVGKSVVSALLAGAFAARGRRVLLVDGDQNLANLHVLLGIGAPGGGGTARLSRSGPATAVRPVAPNLWLLPGLSGDQSLYGLDPIERARLHHRLSDLYDGFEAVVVDAGAGIENVVRAAVIRATRLLLVSAPEPTALTDAYALLKIVTLQLPHLPVDLLVNRCLDAEEGPLSFHRLATASERVLRRRIRFAGALPEDRAIRLAARKPGALLRLADESAAVRTVNHGVLAGLVMAETLGSAG